MLNSSERKVSSQLNVFPSYLYGMTLSITIIIIIVTALISFSAFRNEKIMNDLIFYPPAVAQNKQYYRFITCGFIHADIAHLAFNMISLYLFGELVERQFALIFGTGGKLLYLLMYLLALAVCLLPTYFKNKNNQNYRSLGASGAVSAVVFAGLMISPYMKVGLFIIPPVIPGFVFGPLYLIISAWLDRKGGGNINHSAHIWGALFGVAFLIIAGFVTGRFDAIKTFVDGVRYYFET
jgi:membrane associated rhomboid family serine protease